MAFKGSPDVAFCLLEGRPLHNITTKMTDDLEQVLDQSDGLGDSDDEFSPTGEFSWAASIEGFYNLGAGLAYEGLLLEDPQVLMYALVGNAIGDPFSGVDGVRGKLTTLSSRGELNRIRADFKAHAGPYSSGRGYILAPYATVTDAGPTNLSTLDWGAAFVNQADGFAAGFLGVSAVNLDGGANVTFKIQDSDNDIAYADLTTFTAVTDVTGELSVVSAAAAPSDIERYTQAQYTFDVGCGASRSVTFAIGLVRSLTD